MKATVFTDASYDARLKCAGWAARILLTDGTQAGFEGGLTDIKNSSHAELMGAMFGLWYARKIGTYELHLHVDCEFVINVMSGLSAPKWGTDMYRDFVLHPALELMTVKVYKILGHSSMKQRSKNPKLEHNHWCDTQAGKQLNKVRFKYQNGSL